MVFITYTYFLVNSMGEIKMKKRFEYCTIESARTYGLARIRSEQNHSAKLIFEKCVACVQKPSSVFDLINYCDALKYYYEAYCKNRWIHIFITPNIKDFTAHAVVIKTTPPKAQVVVDTIMTFGVDDVGYERTFDELLLDLFPENPYILNCQTRRRFIDKCRSNGIDTTKYNLESSDKIIQLLKSVHIHDRRRIVDEIIKYYFVGDSSKRKQAGNVANKFNLRDKDIGTDRYNVFITGVNQWVKLGKPTGLSHNGISKILERLGFFDMQ